MIYGSWVQWKQRAKRDGGANYRVQCRSCLGQESCAFNCALEVRAWAERHGATELEPVNINAQGQHILTGQV